MGNPIFNGDQYPDFMEFKKKLEELDIVSPRGYQVVEYFLRESLSRKKMTTFPNESFISSEELNSTKLINYFSAFKAQFFVEWGFHPLVPSGASAFELESTKSVMEKCLTELEDELSRYTKDITVKSTRDSISKSIERMKKNIQTDLIRIDTAFNNHDSWEEQQLYYLAASKIFAKRYFNVRDIDKFIKIKSDLCFCNNRSPEDLKNGIRNLLKDGKFESIYLDNFMKVKKRENTLKNFGIVPKSVIAA